MYNFFSNRVKLRAFNKALKEVEAEGFYANLKVDEHTMPVLPDLSKAVASLSKSQKKEEFVPKTVDISSLESSLEGQRVKPVAEVPKQIEEEPYTKQTRSSIYQSLFAQSPTFLEDDTQFEDEEFLTGNSQDYKAIVDRSTTAEVQEKITQTRNLAFERMTQRINAKREQNKKSVEEIIVKEDPVSQIKSEIEQPIFEKEEEPKPTPKIVVEVVAKPDKPTSTKPKAKPVKKVSTPKKKKRRKYDADIAGGFDF